MRTKRLLAAVLLALALVMAACSSSDSGGSGSDTNNTVDQGVKNAVAAQLGGGLTASTEASTSTTGS
jgi:hypothetical protein